MAAPSGTTWGSIQGGYGRIGIYASTSSTSTSTTVSVEIWFWSKYSVSDSSNTLYFDNLASSGSATTSRGSASITTSVNSGTGWSTSNQKQLKTYSYTYNRGTSAATRYLYAKLANIDTVGSTMSVSKTVSVPKLDSYTVTYNANGGSGAPSSQIKWYGKSLTLSSTKPTRTGYSFQGWATSSSGSVAYAAGASYTGNAALTLYAIWKANTYTVTYNANGGSGAPSNQTKTYGVNLTLSNTKPTRTNYTFKGWGTSASTTTVTYAAGASYTKNSAITLYAVWELAYKKPRITSFSVSRCDSAGTVNDEGTNGLIIFNWACDKTVSSVKIEWKTSAETAWSNTTVSSSGTSGSVSQIIGSNTLTTDSTYTVKVTVADASGSTTSSKTLNGAIFVMDALAGGKGVAFGKPAELENVADFAFEQHLHNHERFDNNKVIYGTKPGGASCEVFNPINTSGNTVIGYGNYDRLSGNTNIYGYDLNFGVSNISTPGTFRPYRRQGDTIAISLRTAGYCTNGGVDVTFHVPFSVPIVGAPTVTASSANGFTLRQGSKYTHGSSASVYALPTSYTTIRHMFNGVTITAKFSDTTNVTNNDAIGIYWDGIITFS